MKQREIQRSWSLSGCVGFFFDIVLCLGVERGFSIVCLKMSLRRGPVLWYLKKLLQINASILFLLPCAPVSQEIVTDKTPPSCSQFVVLYRIV